MSIMIYDSSINKSDFINGLSQYSIRYGNVENYTAPFSPVFIKLKREDEVEFSNDLNSLSQLYSTASELYLASLIDDQHRWIKHCVESGLRPHQIEVTREVIRLKMSPIMMRVDYISFDRQLRKIAEVQWKSGGPGFLIGHDTVYRELLCHETSSRPFGDLVSGYLTTLCKISQEIGNTGCVINEIRSEWMQGENFLAEKAKNIGFTYIPVSRSNIADNLIISSSGKCIYRDRMHPISVLRGRGFSDIVSAQTVGALSKSAAQKKIWIEIPLNYILRQKWPMVLPFHPHYYHLFEDRLREILAPTIIVNNCGLDFSPIVDYFLPSHREQLVKVKHIEDLLLLPESIRRMVVIKNGSGVGDMQNRGKGVFRLTGSKDYVKKMLLPIIKSEVNSEQTWIAQLFISKKYTVPFIDNDSRYEKECHTRFMLFGEQKSNKWYTQGALANFSKNWKVTGSTETSLIPVRIGN